MEINNKIFGGYYNLQFISDNEFKITEKELEPAVMEELLKIKLKSLENKKEYCALNENILIDVLNSNIIK